MRHNNATEVLEDIKRTEYLIKLLITKLEPGELRVNVERLFQFQDEATKGGITAFQEKIVSLAVEVNYESQEPSRRS